ncbi:CHAT domain-containing protein [Stenotrophomonas sp. PSU-St83]
MKTRTIFGIEAMGDKLFAKVVRSPFEILAQGMQPLPLHPDQLPGLDTNGAVLERGKMVRDALRQHQGISGVLDDLGRTLSPQISPLFVQISPSFAELINWEMLCDEQEAFIALDQRWPIARIIDPVNAPQRPPCELTTPIRLLAIISALGIRDQRKEWEHLRDTVLQARQDGMHILVKVMVGAPELFDAVKQEIQSGLVGVEVAAIEQTSSRMTRTIREWAPNILHVFCHGHADALGQALELATATDHLAHAAGEPAASGSVRITSQDLAGLATSLRNGWLLVLNCCASGKAGVGLHSMAGKAVSSGFPSVVAMLEPVDASDAYEFTRAFYPEAFVALRDARDALCNQSSTSVEWAPVLFHARTAIAQLGNRHAQSAPEWSLPALYVRGLDAQTFISPLDKSRGLSQAELDKFRLQAEMTAQWLRTAGQQMSEADRTGVMEGVLATVPKEFWPTLDGRFDIDN